jgi:hypothetical protein
MQFCNDYGPGVPPRKNGPRGAPGVLLVAIRSKIANIITCVQPLGNLRSVACEVSVPRANLCMVQRLTALEMDILRETLRLLSVGGSYVAVTCHLCVA